MSHVRDMSLAESGRMKIRWVQDFMPALVAIRARFEREKPFAGKKITISIHMEAKTAFLALCLAAGGAEGACHGCNPWSTQDERGRRPCVHGRGDLCHARRERSGIPRACSSRRSRAARISSSTTAATCWTC